MNPKPRTSRWPPSPPGLQLSFASETLATPFTRTVIARSVTSVSAPSPQVLGVAGYLWGAWSDGLGQTHAVTAPASGSTTFTATFAGTAATTQRSAARTGSARTCPTPRRAPARSSAWIADRTGVARSVRLYLDQTSEASELVLALYGEGQGEEPAALLATGRNANPLAGGWNAVELESGVPLLAGQPYWIGLLNPLGSGGPLRWRDRAADVGTAERVSLSTTLTALPASWTSGAGWWDGPLSASVWGVPADHARAHPDATRRPDGDAGAGADGKDRAAGDIAGADRDPAAGPPRPSRLRAGPIGLGLRRPSRGHRRSAQRRRPLRPRARLQRPATRLALPGAQAARRADRRSLGPPRPPRAGTIAAQGSAWALYAGRGHGRAGSARGALKLRPLVAPGRDLRRPDDPPLRRRAAGRHAGYSGALGGEPHAAHRGGFRGRLDELRLYDRALERGGAPRGHGQRRHALTPHLHEGVVGAPTLSFYGR